VLLSHLRPVLGVPATYGKPVGDRQWLLQHPVRLIGPATKQAEAPLRPMLESWAVEFIGGTLLTIVVVAVTGISAGCLLHIARSNAGRP
jgi:cobalamin biosynthesis protein CobD/CbiB